MIGLSCSRASLLRYRQLRQLLRAAALFSPVTTVPATSPPTRLRGSRLADHVPGRLGLLRARRSKAIGLGTFAYHWHRRVSIALTGSLSHGSPSPS
jgi:hypothetical protein